RTFFFIVFGMTITADGLNDPLVYVIGFGALIVLYASRFGLVPLLTKKEKFPALFIAPRGLITVLLFFSVPESLAIEGFRPAILLLVILASNIVMTYGLMKHKPEETKGESTHGEEVLIPGQEIDLTAPDSSVTAQKTTTEDVD
ncbi:MAG: hypothetical protein OEX02_15720, partial [Cyclobacteriaceae bacterium]|nr:hypothetical protein [Cyclobacteriaceae bacterium]